MESYSSGWCVRANRCPSRWRATSSK